MAAARNPENTQPTKDRDGFHLIPRTPLVFHKVPNRSYHDILFEISLEDRVARISFDRPEILHAFRPQTIREVQDALQYAAEDPEIHVILLSSTSNTAFCVGGDQNVRSNAGGYLDETEQSPQLRVLELQTQIRHCPKPVIAVVRGYAVGGGHILHMVCDLTLASDNAVFGQTGPRMGSFDAGYGSTQAVALMGPKKARELWYLARFYSSEEALAMNLVNAVFPDAELDGHVAQWVRRIVMNSPTAIAATKMACNAAMDGAAGIQQMGGQLTRLFYMSKEAQEGRQAFLEKRAPDFRSKL